MRALKIGSVGEYVLKWQNFLRGQGYMIDVTGYFDDETNAATMAFQARHKLYVDGIVGNNTYGKAAQIGFQLIESDDDINDEFPARPDFAPIIGNEQRQELFGLLECSPAPTSKNKEAIRILNDFEKKNIIKVPINTSNQKIPQFIAFHAMAAQQLLGLFRELEDNGLSEKIITFDGAYNPRYIRGKAAERILSNHAFGTAFDINAKWNMLGSNPATADQIGCVYEIVPVANKWGFYWGGHFKTRLDGMHFEVARILAL